MAKNTKDGSAEPTSLPNRNRLRTAGWIAGGVLALGATFAAGAAVGNVSDGPRDGGHSVGQTDERKHGAGKGQHGSRGGERGGERHSQGEMRGHSNGSMSDGSVPAPEVTP